MKTIRWYGRGGEGAFTAARLLGAAYSLHSNKYALAFPSFGPERRGAPVHAFTKLDDKPILNRSEPDKADYCIFLDDTLFSESVFSALKPNGSILLNTKHSFSDPRILTIDGDALATEILKMPITNTIMLGALSAVFDGIELHDIEEAVRQHMPQKLHTSNITAIAQAAAKVKRGAAK